MREGRQVDTELVYAYAKTGDLGALEEFITGAQQANLQARPPAALPPRPQQPSFQPQPHSSVM